MYRYFLIILFGVAIHRGHTQERAPLSTILPVMDTYVDEAMKAEGIPGAVVVVVQDGKIIHLKSFGVRILGSTTPVTSYTPFALASVTKNFTVTLMARLVDEGKLHWKDLVSTYLPDFRLSDSAIIKDLRIEDLLSHRSGLPEFSGDSFIELGWKDCEIYDAMKKIPLEGEFRNTFAYQNVMVGIMGIIIQKVTGKPLPQIYKEELFDPLGLSATYLYQRQPASLWQTILSFFKKSSDNPNFHDVFEGHTRYKPEGNSGLFTFPASSGIITTGEDLGKWLIFQLNNGKIGGKSLISKTNMDEMRMPHAKVQVRGGSQFPKDRITRVEYGMGWFIHDYQGVSVLSHLGGMTGTRSLILIIPGDNLGIGILVNFGGVKVTLFPEAIRNKFLDLYLNIANSPDWAKMLREESVKKKAKYIKQQQLEILRNPQPSRNLEDYTGVYENNMYGRITISSHEGRLCLVYRDRPMVRMDHLNGNIFQFNGSNLSSGIAGIVMSEVLFSSETGKAGKMIITLFDEGQDIFFRRVNVS